MVTSRTSGALAGTVYSRDRRAGHGTARKGPGKRLLEGAAPIRQQRWISR